MWVCWVDISGMELNVHIYIGIKVVYYKAFKYKSHHELRQFASFQGKIHVYTQPAWPWIGFLVTASHLVLKVDGQLGVVQGMKRSRSPSR